MRFILCEAVASLALFDEDLELEACTGRAGYFYTELLPATAGNANQMEGTR